MGALQDAGGLLVNSEAQSAVDKADEAGTKVGRSFAKRILPKRKRMQLNYAEQQNPQVESFALRYFPRLREAYGDGEQMSDVADWQAARKPPKRSVEGGYISDSLNALHPGLGDKAAGWIDKNVMGPADRVRAKNAEAKADKEFGQAQSEKAKQNLKDRQSKVNAAASKEEQDLLAKREEVAGKVKKTAADRHVGGGKGTFWNSGQYNKQTEDMQNLAGQHKNINKRLIGMRKGRGADAGGNMLANPNQRASKLAAMPPEEHVARAAGIVKRKSMPIGERVALPNKPIGMDAGWTKLALAGGGTWMAWQLAKAAQGIHETLKASANMNQPAIAAMESLRENAAGWATRIRLYGPSGRKHKTFKFDFNNPRHVKRALQLKSDDEIKKLLRSKASLTKREGVTTKSGIPLLSTYKSNDGKALYAGKTIGMRQKTISEHKKLGLPLPKDFENLSFDRVNDVFKKHQRHGWYKRNYKKASLPRKALIGIQDAWKTIKHLFTGKAKESEPLPTGDLEEFGSFMESAAPVPVACTFLTGAVADPLDCQCDDCRALARKLQETAESSFGQNLRGGAES